MADDPTLYEWAGGAPALRRLIDCFYDRVERDELLSGFFPGGVSEEHRGARRGLVVGGLRRADHLHR